MTRPMDNLKARIAPGADLTADRSTWTWVDITTHLRNTVQIQHGRRSESAQSGPDEATITVQNNDGKFAPDNPLGPWYPDLDEGTPLQIYWDTTDNIRFDGNITDLPIQWRVPTRTALSTIRASGPLERMQQGAQPLGSPIFRALSNHDNVVAYWPCEDNDGATSAASPLMDVPPLQLGSTVTFGSQVDGLPGSSSSVLLGTGTGPVFGRVPNHTPGDVYVVELAWRQDETATGRRAILEAYTTSPDLAWWRVLVDTTDFVLEVYDSEGALVVNNSEAWHPDLFGRWVRAELRLDATIGGQVGYQARLFAVEPTSTIGADDTLLNNRNGDVAGEMGRIVRAGVGGGGFPQERYTAHIAVLTGTVEDLPNLLGDNASVSKERNEPFHGFTGELAADRFERFCGEEGLDCSIVAETGGLRVPGDDLAGSNASTPDAASLDIIGDIDVRAWLAPLFWAKDGLSLTPTIVSKWDEAADDRSWRLQFEAGGGTSSVQLQWSTDGTSGTVETVGDAELAPRPIDGFANFAAIRVTLDVDDGGGNHVATFYLGPSLAGPWTEFHSETVAGTTSIHSGAADLVVGRDDDGNTDLNAVIREARVYDGIAGTLVASPDFTDQEIGATSFDDAQGNTWTVNGSAAIVRADDSMPMGPQQIDTLVANLQDVPTTDGGRLIEHEGGFRYRTRTDLYNQADALTVTPQPHMPDAPQPTRDNQRIRNDITATAPAGTSARATDEASIAKRGRLEDAITVNPETADQLRQIAWWRLHIGTVPGMRWPRLPLRLSPSNPDLINAWLATHVGDRIAVDHEFTQIPGVDIDLLVDGWSELWDSIQWDVTLNCIPAQPYTVAVFDSSRFDTDGSETSGSFVAGTDTSLTVVTTATRPWVNSTDHASEFPLEIEVSGVKLNVTAISGSTSPQTFAVDATPTNGVTKTIPSGSAVRLAQRPVFAL